MRTRTRRIVFPVVAGVLAVALFGGGWVAASMFRSPAQIDAEASPPPSSVIIAPVTRGALAEVINTAGVVANVEEVSTPVPAPEGPGSITQSPIATGGLIEAGDLVLEVNNSPVFAVPGAFPFFRDMTMGDSGADVLQLQNALRSAGYSIDADGRFGQGTANAVAALFRSHNYTVPLVEPETTTTATSPQTSSGSAPQTTPTPAPSPVKVVSAPASSFLVLATLPATLIAAPGLGAMPQDAAILTSAGSQVVRANVVPAVAAQLSEGMTATIVLGGATVALELASIVETKSAEGTTSYDLVFRYIDAIELSEPAGTEGLVSITREVVADDALLVPSRAVLSRGQARYVLVARGGDFVEVPVTEVGALDGTSAVALVGASVLEVGDEVRVQ